MMISLLLSGMFGRKWVAAAVGGRAVGSRSAGDGRRRSGELKKKRKVCSVLECFKEAIGGQCHVVGSV